MLIDFKIFNFRSFKNETEFSMEKGKNVRRLKNNVLNLGKEKLLKTSVLFGGNANGKTNLLSALILLRFLVLNSTQNENQKLITDTFGYNEENTKFEISFIKNKKKFNYLLEYNEDEIITETLLVNNKIFFDRQKQNFKILPKQLLPLQSNIRKNQNLLFFAQSNNIAEAKLAFSWFSEDLIAVNTQRISNNLFKSLLDDEFKNKFLKFLRAADFNIIDVEVKKRKETHPNFQIEISEDGPVLQTSNESTSTTVYEVYCTHKSTAGEFQVYFDNESTGTKVFMFLAIYILRNENSGKVFLIDEFNRSFHIELAEALLDIFNHENQKNQFILTTHELSLMDYNLRQDQVWFAEKNKYGETELFSIYDFDSPSLKRSDFGYKKRYLEGKFGASQIINKTILLEVLEEENGTQ